MSISILFAAAECAPFVKVGGLADVAGALPRELCRQGLDVRVVLPYHRAIRDSGRYLPEHVMDIPLPFAGGLETAGLFRLEHRGVTHYFIESEKYFGGNIYEPDEAGGAQYAFFCAAVIAAMPALGFVPEVLHANDWHTGLMPLLIRTNPAWARCRSLFTIHNMAFQGGFGLDFFRSVAGVPDEYLGGDGMGCGDWASFMKAALVYSDRITTVSPSYAREILTAEYGAGLEAVLLSRKSELSGIVNGIDEQIFDPAADPLTAAPFSAAELEGKSVCRAALMRELGLSDEPGSPLIGMVTRMTGQKGFDLVVGAFADIMSTGCSFVLLGSGEGRYEELMREAQTRYPGRVSVRLGYDEELAHRIYAGADLFLMPSRFEPCGLSQLIAMRYGAVPVVRETGGLRDTVRPFDVDSGAGWGFVFREADPKALASAVGAAVAAWRLRLLRRRLIENAMSRDFGFAASAQKYAQLYESLRG